MTAKKLFTIGTLLITMIMMPGNASAQRLLERLERVANTLERVNQALEPTPAAAVNGVLINNVIWATHNVDTPGTFTAYPENAGGYFSWEQAQNVCPVGWRLPTRAEWESLMNAGVSTANTVNGVDGMLLGTASHQIFLPAAGWSNIRHDGARIGVGTNGHYWSSTGVLSDEHACHFSFVDNGRTMRNDWFRSSGLSVRCVADGTLERVNQAQALEPPVPAVAVGGVRINDVIWATHNVDTPGRFTAYPENAGGYFSWEQAQNVCPTGWRLPTRAEWESLMNAGVSTANTVNGVNGMLLGTASHQIFLPAAGWSNIRHDGARIGVGTNGHYWSSTGVLSDEHACHFSFVDNGRTMRNDWFRSSGLSVRCVANSR